MLADNQRQFAEPRIRSGLLGDDETPTPAGWVRDAIALVAL